VSTKEFYEHYQRARHEVMPNVVGADWEECGPQTRDLWCILHALVIKGGFGRVTSSGDKTTRRRRR